MLKNCYRKKMGYGQMDRPTHRQTDQVTHPLIQLLCATKKEDGVKWLPWVICCREVTFFDFYKLYDVELFSMRCYFCLRKKTIHVGMLWISKQNCLKFT